MKGHVLKSLSIELILVSSGILDLFLHGALCGISLNITGH